MTDTTMQVINPATGENIEEIPVSSRQEVDAAVERARDGFREWQGFAGLDRAEVLHDISARMREHADELAEVMTQEGGKPFIENRDEVTWTAACFDYYGEIARDSVGYLPAPIEPQQLALVVKEPVGTVACIVPWNYPLLLAAWKVAPGARRWERGASEAFRGDAARYAAPRRAHARVARRAVAGPVRGRRGRFHARSALWC
jgi:acyl-CoA reductase-like NAD-dependent aldehyde dehydrogenase